MEQANKKLPERKVGFAEGIDDEPVAEAFSKLQNWPQFKLVRKIPLKEVINSGVINSSQILDFGCGSGHFLVDLSRILHRERIKADLYGLDIAQTMLDKCEENFKRKKVDGIHLILGDGEKIPSEKDFFDVVSTSLSLHHWEHPIQIFTEIYRVVKPGGKFILFDFHRMAAKRWFKFFQFITKRIVPRALKQANEPLGSLESSYTEVEILKFISNTPWSTEKREIRYYGPFFKITFLKNV